MPHGAGAGRCRSRACPANAARAAAASPGSSQARLLLAFGWAELSHSAVAASSTGLIALALGSQPADGMLIRGYAQYTAFANVPFALGAPLFLVVEPSPPPFPSLVGTISNTAPTGIGEIVRIVGYCVGDISGLSTYDRIYFNPSNDWIEL